MKSFIVLALFVAAAVAAPASNPADANAQTLRFDSDNIGLDGFNFVYETSNGISSQQQGTLKNPGTDNAALEVTGQYSYTGPDGVVYTIDFIANEFGFQPRGAHIPTAP